MLFDLHFLGLKDESERIAVIIIELGADAVKIASYLLVAVRTDQTGAFQV